MTDNYYKLPRSFIDQPLKAGGSFALCEAHAHYLHTVMRRKDGDQIRVFNGRNGEWLGTLENLKKKSGTLTLDKQLREQPETLKEIHLFFAPIVKNRMDWLIEKAVELGVSEFHPVLTQNTEVRTIKDEKINAHIREAAEQCERLSVPILHALLPFEKALQEWDTKNPFLACLERFDAQPIQKSIPASDKIAILIGPAGGFTGDEKNTIASYANITPVSLGDNILRSETAALFALSVLHY